MEQNQPPDKHTKELSLLGLSMIVIGSMLGGGVFNLPSSISQSAGVVASLLAWLITGVGVFFIAKVFRPFQRKSLKLSAESTITPKTDLAIILALTPLGAIG